MTGKKEPSDSRLNAARYQGERLGPPVEPAAEVETNTAGQSTMEAREQYVEMAIQQAIRRGEFDNLPGSGKPLANLQNAYDPDWWIRHKIESEKITGLGPPALTLRTEDAALDGRLHAAASEATVREILEDFNKRVISARRQLLGGPPVVTSTRDVVEELGAWRERRARRMRALEEHREQEAAALAAMTWRERRRAKRAH